MKNKNENDKKDAQSSISMNQNKITHRTRNTDTLTGGQLSVLCLNEDVKEKKNAEHFIWLKIRSIFCVRCIPIIYIFFHRFATDSLKSSPNS